MTAPQRCSRQPRRLDAGVFQAEIGSFRLYLAAGGKPARTIRAYTDAVQWFAEACFTACADCGPWPGDELSQIRRVTQMVPREAPDHLLRLAMLFCGRCDLDDQFNLGIELMIRGLDCEDGDGTRPLTPA